MSVSRLHPVTLIFGEMADDRFPAISDAMGSDRSIEKFLLVEPALALLQDLRPEEGIGEAASEFVGFVHAAWFWWTSGRVTFTLDGAATARLLSSSGEHTPDLTSACYIQVEPRRIWARLDEAELYEPIDGWFAIPAGSARRVVACLGMHQARPGLSVIIAEGVRPTAWQRPDGSATFSPRMEGGAAANLASVDSREELLLLAWHVSHS